MSAEYATFYSTFIEAILSALMPTKYSTDSTALESTLHKSLVPTIQ
jgi:hypothetical protein